MEEGPIDWTATSSINSTVARLRERFRALPAPVVVFNKSHSGSRMLAELMKSQGIFMGSVLSETNDALPILPLVEALVEGFYPNYASLWDSNPWPERLERQMVSAFDEHLSGYGSNTGRWGWKLCETTFILPVVAAVFPTAIYVHLLRDGRDVAFTDHIAPQQPFWRKVYFNTDRILEWRGLSLSNRAYERRTHIYNALHWVNSVEIGRAYGTMAHERYIEIKYEDLCLDFLPTATWFLHQIGQPIDQGGLVRFLPNVESRSIGKFRSKPRSKQKKVLRLIEPTLMTFGYVSEPGSRSPRVLARELRYRITRPFHKLVRHFGHARRQRVG
jgi:hypothetical protein